MDNPIAGAKRLLAHPGGQGRAAPLGGVLTPPIVVIRQRRVEASGSAESLPELVDRCGLTRLDATLGVRDRIGVIASVAGARHD